MPAAGRLRAPRSGAILTGARAVLRRCQVVDRRRTKTTLRRGGWQRRCTGSGQPHQVLRLADPAALGSGAATRFEYSSLTMSRIPGVTVRPGTRATVRMPSLASSWCATLARMFTAALVAAVGCHPGTGLNAGGARDVDDAAARRCGSSTALKCLVVRKLPTTLERHTPSRQGQFHLDDRLAGRHPGGVVDEPVGPGPRCCQSRPRPHHRGLLADVGLEASAGGASGSIRSRDHQFAPGGGSRASTPTRVPLRGEPEGQRAPDPLCRSGDHDDTCR